MPGRDSRVARGGRSRRRIDRTISYRTLLPPGYPACRIRGRISDVFMRGSACRIAPSTRRNCSTTLGRPTPRRPPLASFFEESSGDSEPGGGCSTPGWRSVRRSFSIIRPARCGPEASHDFNKPPFRLAGPTQVRRVGKVRLMEPRAEFKAEILEWPRFFSEPAGGFSGSRFETRPYGKPDLDLNSADRDRRTSSASVPPTGQ